VEVGEEGGEVVVELAVEVSLVDLGLKLLERKDVLRERNGEVICIVDVDVLICLVLSRIVIMWNVRLWSWR
jgi:hypothetical protein